MNEDVIRNVLHYFGEPGGWPAGSFTSNIMRAYQGADPGNRARLRLGFPELAEAMDLVLGSMEGIDKLRDRLKENPE
ncbi:MAG TPA: hypothetical protein VJ617_21065 [Arthrobacter sp.]|nr:hypothetical protein [Arthrobacter sp.]